MDFLRQQFAIVQDRLSGLTASQKMLTAALAVIVVMTMLYWGRFASTSERVALLSTPVAGEELTTLTSTLKARGIDVTIENGKVMVPADQQIDAMGAVSFDGAVPASTTNALDAMLDKITPWNTSGQFTARMNSAKQQYLGAILMKWPGVKSADVVITDMPQASITRRDPNLAVYLTTKSGATVDRRRLANSARQFMARCMSGLTVEHIGVSIDGVQSSATGEADATSLSSDSLVFKREAENDLLAKLNRSFSNVPGVLVAVTVEVDNSSSVVKQRAVDPKNKISEEQIRKSETQHSGGGAPQQEPGVVANVALDAGGGAAAPAAGTDIEKTESTNVVDYGTTETSTTNPGGKWVVAGASISVPRSYFVAMWRQRTKADAAKDPTDEEVQPFVEKVLAKMKESTLAVTGIKDEKRLSVTDIWDLEPIAGGPILAAAAPGAAGELTAFATSHAKEVVLGILAVASLFMVSRMVKKAEPLALGGLALAGAGGMTLGGVGGGSDVNSGSSTTTTGGKRRSLGGEDVAGEVAGDAVMMGQELDPDVLETSQIIEQVSSFVKQNPEAAAQMVGRWMSRD